MTGARPAGLRPPEDTADRAARIARARLASAVRYRACPQCPAGANGPCQASPPADHLERWLDAYRAGRVSRDEITTVIGQVTVITRHALVPAPGIVPAPRFTISAIPGPGAPQPPRPGPVCRGVLAVAAEHETGATRRADPLPVPDEAWP